MGGALNTLSGKELTRGIKKFKEFFSNFNEHYLYCNLSIVYSLNYYASY
jgi:hypothetical protein